MILGLSSKITVKCDIDFVTSQYKIWVKPSGEQSFLYGNHILKSGLGRITENTPQYQGVIVYSMNDLPLVSELNSWMSVSHPCFNMQLTLLFASMQSLSHFSIFQQFCTSRSKKFVREKLCSHLKVFVWVRNALNFRIVYKIHHSAMVKQCFWAEIWAELQFISKMSSYGCTVNQVHTNIQY